MFSKILVTGGNGFLGKHVVELLEDVLSSTAIFTPSSAEVDLRNEEQTISYFKKHRFDAVISLAARLGGIGDNRNYPATYFRDNIMIGVNTLSAAQKTGVKKVVNVGTVCSYPKFTPVPFKEEDLWKGYPEETNSAYGIAKKAVFEYSKALENQFGFKCANLLLTNLYGPGDDFREETSHVIPALVKKLHHTITQNSQTLNVWGDGSPSRDFLYVKDAALGIIAALLNEVSSDPINLGSGNDITIKELVLKLSSIFDFNGKVKWDTTKPNGQPTRRLSIERAKKVLSFRPKTSFDEGIGITIQWYMDNLDELMLQGEKYNEN